jgi:Mg-chelatase subunit ChlD/sugar lactone lactonase YvrE
VYHPEGVDMSSDGVIYVAERGNHRVSTWLITGEAKGHFGSEGEGRGALRAPEDVAVDAARDRLYVADTGNRRVQVLNRRTGAYISTLTAVGTPRGIAVGPDGSVYVSDGANHVIAVFDPDLSRRETWGSPGRKIGQLDTPLGLSVDSDGKVYVADSGNQRVQWFDSDGTPSGSLALDSTQAPGGVPQDVGIDEKGDLFVAVERGVLRFSSRSRFAETIWPLVESQEEPKPLVGNHEGVRRLAVTPGVGVVLSYAPSLRHGDLLSVYPRRWFPTVVGAADSQRHAYDPSRIDFAAGHSHVLDTSGLLRLYRPDGTWANERQAYPGGPGIDIAARPGSSAVLEGNTITVTDLACPNFLCQQWQLNVLDPNMMSRYDKTNERVPDPRWWNRAIVSTADGFAAIDTGRGRLIVRTDAGQLLGARQLSPRSGGFQVFIDVATTWDGTLWALGRGGQLQRLDRRGRALESVVLQGLEHRSAEALAMTEVGDAPELFVLTADGWVFKFDAGGHPLAAWSLTSEAGPGRYIDVSTDEYGRVLIPDGDADRILVFEQTAGPEDDPVPDPRGPRCTTVPEKRASPERLPLGGTTHVTLTLDASCGPAHEHTDIVLVLDRGCHTFNGDRARRLKEGAMAFVAALDPERDRVAIVTTPDEIGAPRLRVPFTSDKETLTAELRAWRNLCFYPDAGTMAGGLRLAREALQGPQARRDAGKAVVLISQGYERSEGMWEARRLWRMGAQLHTIGGGPDQYDAGGLADDGLLASMADLPHRYRRGDQPADMLNVWDDVAGEMGDRVLFRQLEIIDRIPENMRLVEGSVQPRPERLADGALRWSFTNVGLDGVPQLSYELEPLEAGRWPTNIEASAVFTDGLDYPGRSVFPVPHVDVIPPQTATARATVTSEPTATPQPSATSTATPTSESTPTPPRRPGPIFLPAAGKPRCRPSKVPADIVLLIDTSSSMAGGKLDAAVSAAHGFVDLLALERDHAAVISFDHEARRVQRLTAERAALHHALDGLAIAAGTRLDLGLWTALDEVDGEGSRTEADGVIVLLTDGLPEPGTERSIEIAAGVAQRVGVTIFAIGLGSDVDRDVLTSITRDADHVYLAPSESDLEAIYSEIARTIPCR